MAAGSRSRSRRCEPAALRHRRRHVVRPPPPPPRPAGPLRAAALGGGQGGGRGAGRREERRGGAAVAAGGRNRFLGKAGKRFRRACCIPQRAPGASGAARCGGQGRCALPAAGTGRCGAPGQPWSLPPGRFGWVSGLSAISAPVTAARGPCGWEPGGSSPRGAARSRVNVRRCGGACWRCPAGAQPCSSAPPAPNIVTHTACRAQLCCCRAAGCAGLGSGQDALRGAAPGAGCGRAVPCGFSPGPSGSFGIPHATTLLPDALLLSKSASELAALRLEVFSA